MELELKPRKVARFLLMLVTGFTLAQIALQIVAIYLEHTFELILFELDLEEAIVRFFSAVMLLLCSSLFLIIAMAKKWKNSDYFLYWLGLAFIFFLLAITKETAIHENLAVPIRSALHLSKIQFYAWAYGVVVVIFPMMYLKFFFSLPKKTMLLLGIGTLIFLAGAFGLDLIVAYLGMLIDHHNVLYIGVAILEDVLEMSGIVVLLYGLLSYMSSELKWIGVKI